MTIDEIVLGKTGVGKLDVTSLHGGKSHDELKNLTKVSGVCGMGKCSGSNYAWQATGIHNLIYIIHSPIYTRKFFMHHPYLVCILFGMPSLHLFIKFL